MTVGADELQLAPARAGGVVASPWRRSRGRSVVWGGLAGGLLWWSVHDPGVGLPAAAITGVLVAFERLRRRAWVRAWTKDVSAIEALIGAGRADEAARAIVERERGSLDRVARGVLDYFRCQVEWQRGDLEGALRAAIRCSRHITSPDGAEVVYWYNLHMLAGLQLELGDLESARPAVERLLAAPPAASRAGIRIALRAQLAFAHDRPEDVGTDDELRARMSEWQAGGGSPLVVAVYAWAWERRGDAAASAGVLAALRPRLGSPDVVARMSPRLWAWLGPKLAAPLGEVVGMSEDPRPLPVKVTDAKDLPSLKVGQRVLIGRDGTVVAPRVHRRRLAAAYALIAGSHGLLIALNPPIGLATAGVSALLVGAGVRWRTRIRAALRLALDDRLDEADQAMAALGTPILRRRRRLANVAHVRSIIAERRGDLDAAVRCSDECLRHLPSVQRGYSIVFWQNQYNRAHWLLELDRADLARAQIARCGRAPGGEWYKMQYRFLVLHAALYSAGELPADDQLHDWLRDSLRYNHTGAHLALLGWAFEQRGDTDTAELAYAESPARFLKGTAMVERIFKRMWIIIGPKVTAAQAALDAAN